MQRCQMARVVLQFQRRFFTDSEIDESAAKNLGLDISPVLMTYANEIIE